MYYLTKELVDIRLLTNKRVLLHNATIFNIILKPLMNFLSYL